MESPDPVASFFGDQSSLSSVPTEVDKHEAERNVGDYQPKKNEETARSGCLGLGDLRIMKDGTENDEGIEQ